MGYYLRVEYEGLHLICFACCQCGHKPTTYPSRIATQPEALVAERTTPSQTTKRLDVEVPREDQPYGPWILVSQFPRKPTGGRYNRRTEMAKNTNPFPQTSDLTLDPVFTFWASPSTDTLAAQEMSAVAVSRTAKGKEKLPQRSNGSGSRFSILESP